MIDVKAAVRKAIEYLGSLYDPAILNDVLLEEVEMSPSHDRWLVTLGFSRPVSIPSSNIGAIAQILGGGGLKREFRVFQIDADNGEVLAMKKGRPMNENDWLLTLVQRHARTGLVIDTNILMVLFVGRIRPDLIGQAGRTEAFVPEDYQTLVSFLNRFNRVMTTPNILTEVSNLACQLTNPLRAECFRAFVETISASTERYFPSEQAAGFKSFPRLGLADSVTILLAREGHLILTEDFDLYQILCAQKLDAINFNHIRLYNWS